MQRVHTDKWLQSEMVRVHSQNLLVQLYALRETDSNRTDVLCLYLMILMVHCVTDGIANNRTFARCLLGTLARGGEDEPA